jgi:hypothetical protein
MSSHHGIHGGRPFPNLNSGQPWQDADIVDLRLCAKQGISVGETADFLCRNRQEVRAKAKELGIKLRWRDRARPT